MSKRERARELFNESIPYSTQRDVCVPTVSQPTCDIMSSSLEKSRHWRGKTSIFQAKKPFKRKGSDKEKERKRDVSVSSEDFP